MLKRTVSLVTLGVADLARSRRFYEEGLGWKASGASTEEVAFFQLGGIALALGGREALAEDARLPGPGPGGAFGGIALAHNVRTRGEVDAVLARARALVAAGRRSILGITGPPGGGKSTLAEMVVTALADQAALVPMDGFHLAQPELVRLGRRDRMGAPDTFDAAGYVALLGRLRANADAAVYAPAFRREIEEPIAGAVPVPASVPLVITEGNYLLLDGAWAPVAALLDACWYVEPDEALRVERLVRRHIAHGKPPAVAAAWVERSDRRNAEIVAATRPRADLVVRVS